MKHMLSRSSLCPYNPQSSLLAQVFWNTADNRSTNITSWQLNSHQDKVGLYGRVLVRVCMHPYVFFHTATIYLKRAGGDGCFLAQRGKMEQRPYATLWLSRMKSKIHPSMWRGQSSTSTYDTSTKRKKTLQKKMEGRGLFSFRSSPDMTGTMKRVRL